jgi:hypothetical protein
MGCAPFNFGPASASNLFLSGTKVYDCALRCSTDIDGRDTKLEIH